MAVVGGIAGVAVALAAVYGIGALKRNAADAACAGAAHLAGPGAAVTQRSAVSKPCHLPHNEAHATISPGTPHGRPHEPLS